MYVYLDNMRAHHTQLVAEWAETLNLKLIFAPTYSSEYNPIERLWAIAKMEFTKLLATATDFKHSTIVTLIELAIILVPTRVLEQHVVRCLAMMIAKTQIGDL